MQSHWKETATTKNCHFFSANIKFLKRSDAFSTQHFLALSTKIIEKWNVLSQKFEKFCVNHEISLNYSKFGNQVSKCWTIFVIFLWSIKIVQSRSRLQSHRKYSYFGIFVFIRFIPIFIASFWNCFGSLIGKTKNIALDQIVEHKSRINWWRIKNCYIKWMLSI